MKTCETCKQNISYTDAWVGSEMAHSKTGQFVAGVICPTCAALLPTTHKDENTSAVPNSSSGRSGAADKPSRS